MTQFRYYQEEADNAIYEELLVNNKCIVKMFCGTGKSLLMRKCKIIQNKKLVVYVFPSLSLIEQFYSVYLHDFPSDNVLRISSENESTTNPTEITQFLSKCEKKIICITYQSFKTLIDNLGEIKINVCIFDEAHHAVGETYQKLIFENDGCDCEKQIFFTATPKNANGIIMYDRERLDAGMCGKLVYDYSYLKGVEDGYLNPIEIRVDMFSENDNKSVYESIARAILASGNSRVLTFHSDVNTDRDTSVNNFVHEGEFKRVFREVLEREFPEKVGYYTDIIMIGLSSLHSPHERKNILKRFDRTSNNRIFVISSCETIGEGIDTKNANMCVFVDPKSSYVKIIQNIGRIVRKQFGVEKPKSTVLIPCWVDKTKYLECNGDRDKCDEVIRQDMDKTGNFNGILNVLSALKQEDEELYDICLHYPDTYSPQEIKSNLEKQGYTIAEQVGEGMLLETMEHLLDDELDYENYEDCETNEEMIMNIAEDNDVCIEIHTNSLENPIERYNSECESGEVIRIYKSFDGDLEEDIYQPIIKKEQKRKRNSGFINEPKRENRMNVKVHTNPDIKVLWNITSDIDLTKDICSCVIDCEVLDNWYDNFEELKKFIDDNEKRPTMSTNKKLTQWLFNNQTHYRKKDQGMIHELRYNEWSKFLEKYNKYFLTDDEVWDKTFEELKKFIDDNESRPTMSTNKKLTQWLGDNQKYFKKKILGMSRETRYNKWSKFLEKYNKYFLTDDEVWNKTFEDLKQFIIYKNRLPSQSAKKGKKIETEHDKQEREKEKKLASWFSHQRNYYKYLDKPRGMKYKKRYNEWTMFIKEHLQYFKNNDELWNDKFKELQYFIDNNYKRPNTKSKNEIEKKLGYWLVDQLIDYRNIPHTMLNDTRYDDWKKFMVKYSQYVMNDDETWNYKFALLKKFIDDNNKRPSNKSKNKLEKDLGVWMTNTNGSYKTKEKGMKNEFRYNLWKEFLEEYAEYFDNSDTQSVASLETEPTIEEDEETIIVIPQPKPKKSMKLKKPTKLKKESTEQKRERIKSEISQLHKEFKTLKSENLNKKFSEGPESWYNYHDISEENEKSFPEHEIPRNRVIQELLKIKTKRTKLVVDMGCGKGQISKYFQNDKRFQFINYDHISSNDTIISCDISNTPLEDNAVEICILSLAMWGSNCKEYIKEANRILESNGKLYIIEPTKRWSEQDENKNIIEGKEGIKLKDELEKNGFKIVEESIEKFCMYVCIKV
jgi:superfamily II DNA or RNA helicase